MFGSGDKNSPVALLPPNPLELINAPRMASGAAFHVLHGQVQVALFYILRDVVNSTDARHRSHLPKRPIWLKAGRRQQAPLSDLRSI